MRLLTHLGASLAFLLSSGCATYRASDFGLHVRLPASRECFEIKVMSRREIRTSPAECDKILSRAIFLTSESWKLLRGDIQTNCLNAKCKQITGAADGLFLAVDKALEKSPF